MGKKLDLPNYIYAIGKDFYPLDEGNCDLSNSFAICYNLPLLKQTLNNKCLTELQNCSLQQTICKTSYAYDSAGILITTNEKITAFQDTERKAIKSIEVSKFKTAFLSWTSNTMVQIGDIFIQKPNLVSSHITPSYSTNITEQWKNFINVTSLKIITLNTTSLNQQLNNLKTSVQNTAIAQKPNQFSILSISLITVAIVLTISGFVIIIIKYRKNSRNCHIAVPKVSISQADCATSEVPQAENEITHISIIT